MLEERSLYLFASVLSAAIFGVEVCPVQVEADVSLSLIHIYPGGIIVLPVGEEIEKFTPVQHPANDVNSDITVSYTHLIISVVIIW